MRLLWSAVVIAAASTSVSAFAPANNGAALMRSGVAMSAVATADVKAKQDASVEKLKAKDASSAALSGDVSFLLSKRSQRRNFLLQNTRMMERYRELGTYAKHS